MVDKNHYILTCCMILEYIICNKDLPIYTKTSVLYSNSQI